MDLLRGACRHGDSSPRDRNDDDDAFRANRTCATVGRRRTRHTRTRRRRPRCGRRTALPPPRSTGADRDVNYVDEPGAAGTAGSWPVPRRSSRRHHRRRRALCSRTVAGSSSTKWKVVPPSIVIDGRGRWASTNTGQWYGGLSPHEPFQSSSPRRPADRPEHVAPHDPGADVHEQPALEEVVVDALLAALLALHLVPEAGLERPTRGVPHRASPSGLSTVWLGLLPRSHPARSNSCRHLELRHRRVLSLAPPVPSLRLDCSFTRYVGAGPGRSTSLPTFSVVACTQRAPCGHDAPSKIAGASVARPAARPVTSRGIARNPVRDLPRMRQRGRRRRVRSPRVLRRSRAGSGPQRRRTPFAAPTMFPQTAPVLSLVAAVG